MDWSLIWTAVGGIAQAAAAIATFLAVGVALWLGIREGRRALQARYDDARPVLQIVSDQANIPIEQGNELYLDWNHPQFSVRVVNVGNEPAFNIKSVIYGPEAIAVPTQLTSSGASWKHLSDKKENHWYHWTTDAVSQGEKKTLLYVLASPQNHPLRTNRFSEANKRIESRTTNKSMHSMHLNIHYLNLPPKRQSSFVGSRLPIMTSFTASMLAFMILFSVRGGK